MQGMLALLAALVLAAHASILDADYYKRLGVSRDEDTRAIRVAFKKLALEMHPDKNPTDENAHAKMAELNEAMSVLTDPDQRVAYDKGGEDGVKNSKTKDKFKPDQKSGSQSFGFYESFGMYDDDMQIQVIDYHSWEASHYSSDAWLITFYTPECEQCSKMADDWRRVGSTLHGAFHVAAINCEENFPVCRSVGVKSLPAVMLYHKGSPRNSQKPIVYDGELAYEPIVAFAQSSLPNVVQTLVEDNFPAGSSLPHGGQKGALWVVGFCDNGAGCAEEMTTKLKLVSMILNELIPVGQVNCQAFPNLCQRLGIDLSDAGAQIITYHHGAQAPNSLTQDIREIAHGALLQLEPLAEANTLELLKMADNVLSQGVRVHKVDKSPKEFLLLFIDQESCESSTPELGTGSSKCYQTLLTFRQVLQALALDWEYSELTAQVYSCSRKRQQKSRDVKTLCDGLNVGEEPKIVLLKEGALNAFEYHDRVDRDEEVLAFVQEAYRSTVHELDHDDFVTHILEEKQTWFVDFFAPWCHHCRDVWPEWNQASKHYDLPKDVEVHFGKINCEANHAHCQENHIHGYPTFLLFHEGVRHQFDFDSRTAEEFVRFIKETLEPIMYEFTIESYQQLLANPTTGEENSNPEQLAERWVVDFFAPWCSHCHVMSPKFREAAKALRGVVKFGKMNCELDPYFCNSLYIRAYPTIWRFEPNQPRLRPTAVYPGLPDPKMILDFAMAEVPDYVEVLDSKTFAPRVREAEENLSWLVFFWSSKEKDCVECEQMQMRVRALASRYSAKIAAQTKVTDSNSDPIKATKPIILNFGSVNCRASGADYTFCLKERIKKYPTLVYYSQANNEQKVIPMEDMLKVISQIDNSMQADRTAVRHPFREKTAFHYHNEL